MHLRIAYLCGTTGWGGLEMNQLKNACWMSERGHHVQIFGQKNSPIANSAREFEVPFVEIQKHKNHYDFLAAWKLFKKLREQRIQHLIIRATFDQSIGASISFLSRGKINVHFFMEMDFGKPKKQFFRTLRYSYFSSWNCPSNYLKKQVESNTNIPTERINVIPSGLNFETLYPMDKRGARMKLNLPLDVFIFGIVGRIDKKKGQLLALQAMQKSSYKEFHVCIIGNPTTNDPNSYMDELTSFVVKHKLEQRVHILPHQQEVSQVFSAFDWTILPSDSESFGMVTIESLACGTPVLGSNAGSTRELITANRNGLLFETKNSTDLEEKMAIIASGKVTLRTAEICDSVKIYNHLRVCEMVEKLLLS